MGPPPPEGSPINNCPNHKFRGLNVTTTKKGRQLFLGKMCTAEKILATRMRKGPPHYIGMGPPNG